MRMKRMGQQSSVLNVDPKAPAADAYIKISGGADLLVQLLRHVWNDWALHVHTNGHNPKSWFIGLACGLAGQLGPGATLTLHSGLAPAYLRRSAGWKREIARFACVLYDRVTCVNTEIADAVAELGVEANKVQITPAFLPIEAPDVSLPEGIESWLQQRSPVISATMFFRPEYGFEVLLSGLSRLKERFPQIGCFVMGSGAEQGNAEALVEKSGLKGCIFLGGDLDHELCLALMARSSMFVRPTFQDGDSISVREALALGVPVVASNVGTRPEGVTLFTAGDVEGLVNAVIRVMTSNAAAGRD
jgi:glycosyltransferase involved in cell wall biosynthesis